MTKTSQGYWTLSKMNVGQKKHFSRAGLLFVRYADPGARIVAIYPSNTFNLPTVQRTEDRGESVIGTVSRQNMRSVFCPLSSDHGILSPVAFGHSARGTGRTGRE
jgi:hypothetical protein